MRKFFSFGVALILLCVIAYAGTTNVRQNLQVIGDLRVGSVASEQDGSAAVDFGGNTDGGLLPPRMTTAQRDAISNPSSGLVIFNVSTNLINVFNDSSWQELPVSAEVEDENLLLNVGITDATTSVASDSIEVTSKDHSALSATNVLKIAVQSTTPGQVSILSLNSDVVTDLTGAHWGMGTNGDETQIFIFVYAINDTGSLKFGYTPNPSLTQIVNTDTSATTTDITTVEKVLVSSALNAGTWPARRIGWVRANFDDTGGSSEDLWFVDDDIDDLYVGAEYPKPGVVFNSSAASQNVATSSISKIDFANEEEDTYGWVTGEGTGVGGNWEFTAKITGWYSCYVRMLFDTSSAWTAGELSTLYLYKNASVHKRVSFFEIEASGTYLKGHQAPVRFYARAGDGFDFRVDQDSGSTIALSANGTNNTVSCKYEP